MATNAAEIEFIPDEEIDFVPDEPIDFVPDQPVDVNQEAARSTAGALQAIDLATLPGKLDWSEAAADEVNSLREQAAAQFQARNAPVAQKLSSQAMRLDEKLQQEAPQSTGAQRLRGQYQNLPQPNVEGFQGANFLGRGLSQIAQTVGLTPLAHNIEQAGQSPIGLNFQANIGGAIGGAAGAAAMMVPGGQGLGASSLAPMLAPLAGGLFGGLAGGAGQEVIQRATETPEQTGARHEALAETERESPFASALGRAVTNAPFMRPSLSVISEAMAGNKTAQAAVAAAGGIGAAMGAGGALLQGQKPSLAGIAESALSNLIFNKPTRLGRALGLPAVETGRVEEQTGFEPITIEPDAKQISETSPPDGGVRAPEVPIADAIVPTDESGTGVQPSGQGEPLAETAPETPREVAPIQQIRPAIKVGDQTIVGESGQTHREILNDYLSSHPDEAPDALMNFDTKENPNIFVGPEGELSRTELKEKFGVSDSQGLAELQKQFPPAQTGENPTGIRNAIVDPARAEAGIPPREIPLARSFPQIHEEARAALANDPEAGRRLVSELGKEIRPLTDTEDAVLTFEQNSREQERTAAVDAVNNAPEGEARDAAIARLSAADDALFEVYQVGQQAGTANARGLNARRLMQNKDFTLSKMLNERRAIENNGEPLTQKQTEETEALYKRIAELESKLAKKEVSDAKSAAQNEFRRVLRETKKQAGEAAKAKEAPKTFFERTRESAKQRIIDRRGRLQVTVDPLNIAGLVDEAIIGASYVGEGIRDFAKWSAKMLSDFGERIRPHLDALYAKATSLADDTIKTFEKNAPKTPEQILGNIEAGAKLERSVVYDLARAHVNAGMEDFNQVMTRVTEDLKPKFPNITERQVMDALSGYGKISTPNKQEDLRKLREFRNLARLTSQLEDAQKGIPPKKTGAQRDKATLRVRELQRKVNDAMRAAGIERTGPEQIASGLQSSKTRIRNMIEELQARIKKNDYEERPKREPALDREKIDLQHELSKVKEKWNIGLIEAKRAKRPLGQKIFEGIGEGINLARQLVTSGDFPPVFRQGLFAIGRPITMAKATIDSFKAMVSEKQRFRIMQEIENRPNAPLYSRSKLYLAKDTAQPLSQMEENFMGNWFKQLPRWTIVGPLLRASERSYNTFLNKLRADTFDSAVKMFNISETDTASLKALAANVNTFTGRSTLPGRALEQGAPALNTLLFAPRFMMSRFKIAAGQPLWGGTAKSRLAALDTYARTLGGVALMYGLAKMGGAEIETDPRSSDFGKIKMGQTRLDPLGGLSQITTFLTRVITGETKTGKGKLVPLREGMRPLEGTSVGAKGKPNMIVGGTGDVLKNFLRSKLNPAAGTVWNLIEGKDITGKPVTPASTLVNTTVPISYQDILSTMEKQGIPRGAALFTLSLFGMGLNTYEDRKK